MAPAKSAKEKRVKSKAVKAEMIDPVDKAYELYLTLMRAVIETSETLPDIFLMEQHNLAKELSIKGVIGTEGIDSSQLQAYYDKFVKKIEAKFKKIRKSNAAKRKSNEKLAKSKHSAEKKYGLVVKTT